MARIPVDPARRSPPAYVATGSHEGPCRWPHLATVSAESTDESEVRSRIVETLQRGRVDGAPQPSAWTVLREGRDDVRAEEARQALRLVTQ